MYLTRLEILGTPMDPQTTQHPPFTSLYHQSPELPFFYPGNGIPWYHSIGKSPFSSPLPSPTSCLPRNSDSPVPLRTTPSPPRFPPGFEPSRQHRRSGSFNNLDFRDRTRSDFSAVSCDSDRIQSQRESASDGGEWTSKSKLGSQKYR